MSVLLVTVALALAQGPTVTLRVVDAYWSPLPGATVELIPVQNCIVPQAHGSSDSGYTDNNGQIEIAIGNSPAYVVRAHIKAGVRKSRSCVRFGVLGPDTRAYVELRFGLDPRQVTGMSSCPAAVSAGTFERSDAPRGSE